MTITLKDLKEEDVLQIDATGEVMTRTTLDKLFEICEPCPVDPCYTPCDAAKKILIEDGYRMV